MTRPATHEVRFTGGLLERGFWLYVWEITTPQNSQLHYVGRTGDSSSAHAQSPFNRIGQHLGFKKESNALRRHLRERGFDAEDCSFCLLAYGPIFPEALHQEGHRESRDKIAAMEKALACAMVEAGYEVMNRVSCRFKLDELAFVEVRSAFEASFPKLGDSKVPSVNV
jgi:hypothetical protein